MNFKVIAMLLAAALTASCGHLSTQSKTNRGLANSPGQNEPNLKPADISLSKLIPRVNSSEDTDQAFERFKRVLDSGVNPNLSVICKKRDPDSSYVSCGLRNYTAIACGALNSRYLDELIKRDMDNLNGKNTGGLNSHAYNTCLNRAFDAPFKTESILEFIKEYVDRGLLDLRFADEGYVKLKGESHHFTRDRYMLVEGKYLEIGYDWLSKDEYPLVKFLNENGVNINYYVTAPEFPSTFKSYEDNSASILEEYIKLGFDVNFNGDFRHESESSGKYILIGILKILLQWSDDHPEKLYRNQIETLKVVLREIGKFNIEKYPYLDRAVWLFLTKSSADGKIMPYEKRAEVVKMLVESGASIKSFYIDKPVIYRDIGAVKILLKSGADVNYSYENNGETTLYKAARDGNLELVKLLVENNADASIKYGNFITGKTPEKIAKKRKCIEVYEYLKAHRLKNKR